MRIDINFWIINFILIAVIYSSLLLKAQSVILDSRCYLEGGGSAESFFASENMTVGSVIGHLSINGNPSIDKGDINLSLREKDAPVKIIPGTKDLALIVALDKEGVKGPSSIYVNVICDRRHSTDPSFVIPVNVRVTDVNDNAPQWIGAPYTLTLSEVTVPGTRILQGARAVDDDQQGPFSTVEYAVLPGPNSDFVQFLNPLEGTLVLKKALDYETLQNFTIRLRAQDQGVPPKHSDTLLRVIITDADDQNPKFLQELYRGDLPLDGRPSEIKTHPEPIKAIDQDEGICAPIQYTMVQSPDTKYFRINPKTGVISLITPIGYTDFLNGATLVIKATQIDNLDRYALTTVTTTRPGTHSGMTALNFLQKKFTVRVREDSTVGSRLLSLPTNKPGKHLKYHIPDLVQSQYFSVGSLGEVILQKPLDFEKMTKHVFEVVASDGLSNTTTEVTIEVIDVNDWEPRFRASHYEFIVSKDNLETESLDGIKIGKLEAADGDRNDKLEISLKGLYSNMFEIDSTGNIYMRPESPINQSTIHLIATATDTGTPPRSTSVPVTITMEGLTLAQTSWTDNILGMFLLIVGAFIIIILGLSFYICRSKKPVKSRNRVHSQAHSTVSSAGLVTHEKMTTNGHNTLGGNITMSNPINGHHHGSGSSLSAGASTILAASLEREAQRERELERQRENYTATVRSIVSRASAAQGGQLYDGEMIDGESIINPNESPNGPAQKKLCWPNGNKNSELMSSTDNMGSTENNLTVYF
ncbi:protocadherin-16 [Condylostylus longicornis]|uniref:protocadherin-16 n=1 Tax=Condylostylus longicornis TaxID=2530218 RepID=UPI00244E06C4|nr:protocadherin-16 [Condylostylus longicornis]XP_055377566.1 protocadherin-16 [Condylostylus longicornis]